MRSSKKQLHGTDPRARSRERTQRRWRPAGRLAEAQPSYSFHRVPKGHLNIRIPIWYVEYSGIDYVVYGKWYVMWYIVILYTFPN